jgi:hypothetical protein
MGKKNNQKGKRSEIEAATAQTADAFDDMLAEFRAADLAIPAATTTVIATTTASATTSTTNTNTPSSSSFSSSSSSTPNATRPEEMSVSDDMILAACARGDITQLQRWGRQGVRVHSGLALAFAAGQGTLDVIKCLVEELGASVDDRFKGYAPLDFAAQNGCMAVVKCLVKEFGAINQDDIDGATPLMAAPHL